MRQHCLWLTLFVLSVSSLALAQTDPASQNQQQAQQQSGERPKTGVPPAPTPTPTPQVIGVLTYANDKLCDPTCEVGIGDKLIVEIKHMTTGAEAAIKPSDLVLFLDGQPINGNPGVPVRGGDLYPAPSATDSYLLEFQLNRTDESRGAWASLLGSPNLTKPYRKVTVGVGKPDSQPFASDGNTKIELRSYYRGWLIGMLLFVIAAVAVFVYLARTTNIIRDSNPPQLPAGAKKPYSLALAQAAVWFFLVIGSFLFIALVTGDYNTITTEALVLMGIGTGTALGAAMIDNTKRSTADTALSALEPRKAQLEEEEKQLKAKIDSLTAAANPGDQQTLADASVQLKDTEAKLSDVKAQIEDAKSGLSKPVSEGFARDLLTDADGVNFHRFQMLVWTVVLGCFFVYGVYKQLAMPQFSATLLALMGISSGTYLGFKIPEKQS